MRMTMPRMIRPIAIAAAAVMLAVPGIAAAQDATPGSPSSLFPIMPAAANCTVAKPRTADDIQRIVAAGSSVATPQVDLISEGTPITNQPSSSAPADDVTVAAITSTLVTYYGCVNSGDLLAASALETDGFVAQQIRDGLSLSGQPLPKGRSVEDMITGTPAALPAAQQIRIIGVRDAIVLRTGDVRAVVEISIPDSDRTASDTISFMRQPDGSFLIGGAILDPAHKARPAR